MDGTVIRLSVSPVGPEKPALKYHLLPEVQELQPGNLVQALYKCTMEQNHFYYDKEAIAERDKYLTCPLSELKGKNLTKYGGASTGNADYAARLETVSWELLPNIRANGVYTLLPDIQGIRMVANALKVRFRAQVAESDFAGAVESAKTIFAIARSLNEHPTLIGDLVGLAIANIGIGPLEEMIGQPGCPNLYWPLTNLPAPFMDMRKGFGGERIWVYAEFPGLFDDPTPKSPEQMSRHTAKMTKFIKELMGFEGARDKKPDPFDGEKDFDSWLKKRTSNDGAIRRMRASLRKAGYPADSVDRMPPVQVVMIDEFLRFRAAQDESFKWFTLPYWQAEAGLSKMETPRILFGEFLSATRKVRQAQARIDQRFALLRHVEAIRAYSAAHDGKLPGSLDKIEVPLPIDPVTGKAFLYEVKGGTAILRGMPPAGHEKEAAWNVRYEITIRK
jgi:hypothetical protein